MMSRSSARDSYVAKRPLMTITYCRNPIFSLFRIFPNPPVCFAGRRSVHAVRRSLEGFI